MPSDATLVDRALGGDRTAYGELICRYTQCVMATAWHVLRDYHAAEDAVQEVFLHAYQKLGGLRDHGRFGPWVIQIARRHAVRAAANRKKTVSLDAAETPAASDADRHSATGQLGDDQQELLDAVARLPEHEQVVVALRYFQDRGVHEIAEITGRPVGTVTKQLSRSHRRLRELLLRANSNGEKRHAP